MNKSPLISSLCICLFAMVAVSCAASGGADDGASGVEIGENGGMCGGIAGFQCKTEGDYCKVQTGICADTADYSGICTKKPQACTMQYEPVCGCNGKTYGNACSAAGEGVSVAHKGECAANE